MSLCQLLSLCGAVWESGLGSHVSVVSSQAGPGHTDQETEEQQQFRNIFRQIAGDVRVSLLAQGSQSKRLTV